MAEGIVSQADYARHRGKSRQYINRMVQAGRIPLEAGGLVDVAKADAAMAATADPSRGAGGRHAMSVEGRSPPPQAPPPAPVPRVVSDFERVKTADAMLQMKQREVRYRKEVGELVDREATIAEQFTAARRVRDAVMGIVPVISMRLVGIADVADVRRILAEALREALMRTSGGVRRGGSEPDGSPGGDEAEGAAAGL